MSNRYRQNIPSQCQRSAAQEMRLRLARTRRAELHVTDLGETDPAGLMAIIERLAHSLDDLIALIDEGCGGSEPPRGNR